jgi:C-terminal processing protease CtpA/Prc
MMRILLSALLFCAVVRCVMADEKKAQSGVELGRDGEFGKIGFKGVRMSFSGPLSMATAGQLKGLKILAVWEGSPAQQAGIMADDKILSVGGEPITTFTAKSLKRRFAVEPGQKIPLQVLHHGQAQPQTV